MMSRLVRIEMAADLDTNTAEAQEADGTLIGSFGPLANRAPAAMVGLRVPSEAFESIWAALEDAHRNLNRTDG